MKEKIYKGGVRAFHTPFQCSSVPSLSQPLQGSSPAAPGRRELGGDSGSPGRGLRSRVRGCQRSREADVGAWGYDALARMARCQGHWPPVVINQYGAEGEGGKERQAPSGTRGRERQRQPAVPAAAAAEAAAVATGELSE